MCAPLRCIPHDGELPGSAASSNNKAERELATHSKQGVAATRPGCQLAAGSAISWAVMANTGSLCHPQEKEGGEIVVRGGLAR